MQLSRRGGRSLSTVDDIRALEVLPFRARSLQTSSARFLRSRPVHSTWTQMAGAPSRGTGHL
ncbi:hypothetical protein [Brevibacterium sp. FAM 27836]|uniref:hypothetical protein n=1 Tax=Brevibacterium sp. FAM 27836 TaxID=3446693 RepID=UPI003F512EB8